MDLSFLFYLFVILVISLAVTVSYLHRRNRIRIALATWYMYPPLPIRHSIASFFVNYCPRMSSDDEAWCAEWKQQVVASEAGYLHTFTDATVDTTVDSDELSLFNEVLHVQNKLNALPLACNDLYPVSDMPRRSLFYAACLVKLILTSESDAVIWGRRRKSWTLVQAMPRYDQTLVKAYCDLFFIAGPWAYVRHPTGVRSLTADIVGKEQALHSLMTRSLTSAGIVPSDVDKVSTACSEVIAKCRGTLEIEENLVNRSFPWWLSSNIVTALVYAHACVGCDVDLLFLKYMSVVAADVSITYGTAFKIVAERAFLSEKKVMEVEEMGRLVGFAIRIMFDIVSTLRFERDFKYKVSTIGTISLPILIGMKHSVRLRAAVLGDKLSKFRKSDLSHILQESHAVEMALNVVQHYSTMALHILSKFRDTPPSRELARFICNIQSLSV